jgi:hypothetical protein
LTYEPSKACLQHDRKRQQYCRDHQLHLDDRHLDDHLVHHQERQHRRLRQDLPGDHHEARNHPDLKDDHRGARNHPDLADDRQDVNLDHLGVDLHLLDHPDEQPDAERQEHQRDADQHYRVRTDYCLGVDRQDEDQVSPSRMDCCLGVDRQDEDQDACPEWLVQLVQQPVAQSKFALVRSLQALQAKELLVLHLQELQQALPQQLLPALWQQPSLPGLFWQELARWQQLL